MSSFTTIVRVGLSLTLGGRPLQFGSFIVVIRVHTMAELDVTSPTRKPIARWIWSSATPLRTWAVNTRPKTTTRVRLFAFIESATDHREDGLLFERHRVVVDVLLDGGAAAGGIADVMERFG